MFSRSIRALLSILILGSGWRLYLYYDHSLWAKLVETTTQRPQTAWLVFVIGLYALTYVGLLLIRDTNAKPTMTISLSAALLLSVGIRLFPFLGSYYIAFALLGAATGVFNAAIVYYGSSAVPPEGRLPLVALVVMAFTVIVYALTWAARSWGIDVAFALASALMVACIVINSGYEPAPLTAVPDTSRPLFPTRLVVASGITIFVGYFGNYLNQSGTGAQEMGFPDPLYAWVGLAVRVAICIFFVVAGRRIRIVHILYVSQGCTVLAFATSMLPTESNLVAWIFQNTTNIVGTIALYALISAVAYKYLRRPQTFALLLLLTGAGIIFGYLAGTAVHRYLGDEPFFFHVVPLLIFCSCFFALPFIIREIEKEVDLDRSSSPGFFAAGLSKQDGAPAMKESDVIVFRKRITESLTALNNTFDKEYRLTNRESEIASYLAERYDYETIAGKLFISINTLKVHIRSIYRKYDIPNRKSLIELIERKTDGRAAG
jgi:DNA-binding CsgD family transcriptional regulator